MHCTAVAILDPGIAVNTSYEPFNYGKSKNVFIKVNFTHLHPPPPPPPPTQKACMKKRPIEACLEWAWTNSTLDERVLFPYLSLSILFSLSSFRTYLSCFHTFPAILEAIGTVIIIHFLGRISMGN